MHRATPLNSSFRSYSAGGARSVIPEVDDSKLMQESINSRGMSSEQHPTMEAPQNYGFTSVVADAEKSGNPGNIIASAEGFISFIGGNRSFPVMGIMDDRRHRLLNLAKDAAKGATAMFGLKEWGQQLLNTKDGWFMTGNTEKKMRLQLVDNKNGQQQQSGGGGGGGGATKSGEKSAGESDVGVAALADGSGGGSSGGGSSGGGQSSGQQKGQKTLHKEQSETFIELLGKEQQQQGGGGASSKSGGGGSGSSDEGGVITIKAKKQIILQVGKSQIIIDAEHINVIASLIHEVGKCYHGQSQKNGTSGPKDETISDIPAKQVWNEA